MIVQVINIGGIAANQFDLLIPGGGVGANNACTGGSAQWSGANIGDTNGGMLTTCKDSGSCVQQMCQAAFGNMPQLLAGCNWVNSWSLRPTIPRWCTEDCLPARDQRQVGRVVRTVDAAGLRPGTPSTATKCPAEACPEVASRALESLRLLPLI